MRKRMSGSVLLLATLGFSLIVGDVLVLTAQDPQTPAPANPTTQPQPQTPETQSQTPTSTTKKRTSKKKRADTATTTATGDETTPPADSMPAPGQQQPDPAQMPAQTTTPVQTTTPAQPRANMAAEQTDLSGTYAGTFNCDALGLTGDTTLTITGNQFTTADGKSGRIVASTTSGYTAVALQTGEIPTGTAATGAATTGAAAAAPPTIVSLRARRSGNNLTLTPASGSTMECRFTPSRNVARGRRSRQRTPAATGTEVSNPATMPSPTAPTQPAPETPAQPMPEQPIPSQTPSPTPMPSPTPSGSPTPMPSPTPSGSPTPEPTPSPTPSPSPARPRG